MATEVFQIDSDFENSRLDYFLSEHVPELSRSQAQKAISNHQVLVNQKPSKASYKLKLLDKVQVQDLDLPLDLLKAPEQEPLNVPIVFEDEHIIVINKPAGMVTHPGAGNTKGTVVNAFAERLAVTTAIERPGVVHRLDKDTQGLLVLAKTQLALESLARQFKEKTARRMYWAVAHGKLKNDSGSIKSHLARNPKNRKKFSSQENGKEAITHYKLKTTLDRLSLLELQLETGRTHQIRVHLSEMGHPILHDVIYGSEKRLNEIDDPVLKSKLKKTAVLGLVAIKLEFEHPSTKEQKSFSIEWPKSLSFIEIHEQS